jgi:hypothetical protein
LAFIFLKKLLNCSHELRLPAAGITDNHLWIQTLHFEGSLRLMQAPSISKMVVRKFVPGMTAAHIDCGGRYASNEVMQREGIR